MNEKISNYIKVEERFISESMKSPLLSKEQEQSLTKLWKNNRDTKALEKIILSYNKLVIRIASQFKHYGLPFNDLSQEGHIGLLLAIEKFGGKYHVRGGKFEIVEGKHEFARNVIVEFESFEIAKNCFNSQEYQEAIRGAGEQGSDADADAALFAAREPQWWRCSGREA